MQTVADQLAAFVDRHQSAKLLSTHAEVVDYHGTLYNISGSSHDPEIDGASWRQLLIRNGIDGNCYVKVTTPEGSHPKFDVGGHMTPNSDGSVERGSECYLMPLCKWHNSTARNGHPFTLTNPRILKLYGYMLDDMALTFMARMPSDAPFSLIYEAAGTWHTQAVSEDAGAQAHSAKALLSQPDSSAASARHILFRRVEGDADGETRFVIEDAQI
ncbi:hypothetical protein [Erythrobacter sp. BLCC-B19]|uniref:hypothetical protein n=1 Tax=Erythrobacter sp. BLCC-B19 TaxID=3025315 RepID=UPI00235F6D7A|nr:hypothetical protein [Erythrobacter sp. BLCC-B19]WDA41543.1 hypothetical protein PS060_01665 [Erythrobacter sp. BLCC-B19]